jgi:NAD(P)-dependent dehydrogenase (short-subunit alcohol dehydrogenase family)
LKVRGQLSPARQAGSAAPLLVDSCADGASVALVDMQADQLEAVPALALTADVAQERDVQDYASRAVEHFGKLDLFFNKAGTEGRVANIVDTNVADFERVMNVNGAASFWDCARYCGSCTGIGLAAQSSIQRPSPDCGVELELRRILHRSPPSSA